MQHDTLSDAFAAINNATRIGKDTATIEPATDLVKNVLMQLQKEGYVGVFELVEDGKGGKFKVEIGGNINECQPVKPNFFVKAEEYTKWSKRYLPARNFGHLIVTTPKGVMTHEKAQEEHVGGKLLGYIY